MKIIWANKSFFMLQTNFLAKNTLILRSGAAHGRACCVSGICARAGHRVCHPSVLSTDYVNTVTGKKRGRS